MLLLGGAALLQRLTREEKPAVYEYGLSLDKETYTPASASVSLPNNETFYFHAAMEHLPPDILITAECHLKTATGTTLFTSVTALKTTSRAVHRLTCAFSGHQVNAGSWFMELDLKQQETGEDTNRMPFQTFGRFPVTVKKDDK